MRTLLPRTGRRVLLASAAVIALAAAGIAIAGPGGPASTSLVSATFYANTLVKSHSETCTPPAPGDAYTMTDAVFTGTASSSDPRLAGPITIHVKSVYDTTKNVGSLRGNAEIDSTTTPPGHFHGRLNAVNVNGVVQGWFNGNLGDGSQAMARFRRHLLADRRLQFLRCARVVRRRHRDQHGDRLERHCDQRNPHPGGPKHHTTASTTTTSSGRAPVAGRPDG
jgi:hypothetical protein